MQAGPEEPMQEEPMQEQRSAQLEGPKKAWAAAFAVVVEFAVAVEVEFAFAVAVEVAFAVAAV